MIQIVLTTLIVLSALAYLIRRYFFRAKNKGTCGGCEQACGINSKNAIACQKPLANMTEKNISIKNLKR